MGKQFFYRGYLTSCNYACGYCPFSKRKMTEEQRRKDQEALEQFVCQMTAETEEHALLIVPYGEALIQEYYWVAMAGLSQIPSEEYVGCQTNLSFPVKKMLSVYEASGGEKQKLRLWCTFHPSMTKVEAFVGQCQELEQADIAYCVGAVGDPDEILRIQELRKKLPEHVYVWINQMDGRKKRYTEEEVQSFQKIDPYFSLELKHYPADSSKCRKSVFQEADGSRYFCNLHAAQTTNSVCKRRECRCYLAYCNRTDVEELFFFEPYPAFRIPTYPQGIFLDIDGTLVAEGKRALSDTMAEKVRFLAQKSKLYLATALPYPEAMGKCRKIADCLSGGVFADGGHILVWENVGGERRIKWEEVVPLWADEDELSHPLGGGITITASVVRKNSSARQIPAACSKLTIPANVGCCSYQIRGVVYKQTLFSRRKQGWLPGEAETLVREIGQSIGDEKQLRFHIEKKHIGITSVDADKKTGVEKICAREGIARKDGMAIGNEKEDLPMLSLFPRSVYLGDY